MVIVKCINGHYFDSSKFEMCPHCGAGVPEPEVKESPAVKQNTETEEDVLSDDFPKTEAYEFSVTDEMTGPEIVHGNDITFDDEETVIPDEEIQFVSDEEVVPVYTEPSAERFAAGWVMCIEGPERGRDYRIFEGWNRIGRDPAMRIHVPGDEKLAEDTHASVVYDDLNGMFYIVNQQGNQTYLNGELCIAPVELHSNDVIMLGGTKLVFIAFCTEDRKWDND